MHVLVNAEGIGVAEPVDEGAACRAAGHLSHHGTAACVIHDGADLPNVRVNRSAENDHLQHRQDEGKQYRHRIATHVPHFLVKDRSHSLHWVLHDAASICICRRWLNSTNASSRVGISGRTSSNSMLRLRSSCSSSCWPTDSSTSAWMERPNMVALLNSAVS